MTRPWLAIIGINEDGALAPEASALLARATLVVGGARHLALAAPLIQGALHPWRSPIEDTIPAILARRPAPVAVLASGDPLWFGAATMLLRHVPLAETRIIPAPSSFALAAARLGWPLQHTACLSCCGRPIAALIPHLQPGARLLVLSAGPETPAAIAALLNARGMAASTLHILESLGGPTERHRTATPAEMHAEIAGAIPADIAPLNLLAIEVACPPSAALPLTPGLDDSRFEHDGQITKHDIRALTLSALAPRQGELLWDIGCGSGSIGIEWMLRHPGNHAIGIDPRPDRAARARRNAAALGVPSLHVIEGRAPEALAALPAPHAIFLGGGAHAPGVIEAAWSALGPGGRLVANAITLPTEAALIQAQSSLGGTLTRIAIERLDQVGAMAAYRPAMTVTQWRIEK
jgi:precorrin-6Y C5,15-methyltransferase (decarboxylating)